MRKWKQPRRDCERSLWGVLGLGEGRVVTMREGRADWGNRVGCDEVTQRTNLKKPSHGLGLRAGPVHLVHRNGAENVPLLRMSLLSLAEHGGC